VRDGNVDECHEPLIACSLFHLVDVSLLSLTVPRRRCPRARTWTCRDSDGSTAVPHHWLAIVATGNRKKGKGLL